MAKPTIQSALIESVRVLANAVEKRARFSDNWIKAHFVHFDFAALIKALERAERANALMERASAIIKYDPAGDAIAAEIRAHLEGTV